MEPTIHQSIKRINSDVKEIASIDPKTNSDRVKELVSDIKTQFLDVNAFNYNELSGSIRSECEEKLEKIIQKIENMFGEGIISNIEEKELKDAIGQARLHVRGFSFEDIQKELIVSIMDYFNHEQIENVFIGLSKKLSKIAQDKSLLSKKVSLDQRALQAIQKFVEHDLSQDVLSKRDLEILKSAKALDLSEVNFSPGVLRKIVNLCPQIQHLKIQSGVTDEMFLEVPDTVTSLDVSGCHSITVEGIKKLYRLKNLTQINTDKCLPSIQYNFKVLALTNKINILEEELSKKGEEATEVDVMLLNILKADLSKQLEMIEKLKGLFPGIDFLLKTYKYS